MRVACSLQGACTLSGHRTLGRSRQRITGSGLRWGHKAFLATRAGLDAALTTVLGRGHHVVLTADLGPSTRYRAFLAVRRGHRRVVVGTRVTIVGGDGSDGAFSDLLARVGEGGDRTP